MAYSANVLRVMIASPSDTIEARDAVETAIHGWNGANAQTKQTILQSWRWETSSVPILGGHPQSLINSQGVDESDIVFALFGSRLGSPTPDAVSGTVEEIERAIEQGKPVHLYFSTAQLPNDVDTAQLDGLRAFKSEISKRGLLGEFSNASQLEYEVWKAIEYDIANLSLGVPVLKAADRGVRFSVQPRQEREIRSYDRKGKPRYSTRHWLEITNDGGQDAEEVVFEPVGERISLHLATDGTPTTVHAGQTRLLNVVHSMGGGDPNILRIRWKENGENKDRDFHVG
ncbi:DUF4062 domain-containing protein [Streptomyces sp. SID13726]|uniref:DUF4062 domain-containing protein n=1 Tax=Streptomyces sp. SID13726 TaxID=2706058 RepID=UPI0013BBE4A4|nr:DUF4062 domain-containing protein [Streptomyces sp. SID13726]NEB05604.1 DUF4062 domain-containing protein [Streptomyces sp. SID13726]